jgi:hypothetical protein
MATAGANVIDRLRERWPKDDVEYVRLIATTLLILVLLPLALARLVINPIGAANAAIGAAAK